MICLLNFNPELDEEIFVIFYEPSLCSNHVETIDKINFWNLR